MSGLTIDINGTTTEIYTNFNPSIILNNPCEMALINFEIKVNKILFFKTSSILAILNIYIIFFNIIKKMIFKKIYIKIN